MHRDPSYWRAVTREGSPFLLLLCVGRVQVGLINIIVLSSNIKLICFFFRELHSVHSDHGLLILLRCLSLVEKIHVHLRVTQLSEMPLADLAVV